MLTVKDQFENALRLITVSKEEFLSKGLDIPPATFPDITGVNHRYVYKDGIVCGHIQDSEAGDIFRMREYKLVDADPSIVEHHKPLYSAKINGDDFICGIEFYYQIGDKLYRKFTRRDRKSHKFILTVETLETIH